MPSPSRAASRTPQPPLRAFAIGLVLGLALLAAAVIFGARRDFGSHGAYAGTPVEPAKFAPDAVLLDQNGRLAHLFEPNVPLTFLFFGYTHCPDECPLALGSLGRAYRTLTRAQAARTRIVFVSVDPERDRPAVVKRYVDGFDATMTGLTGNRKQLEAVWRDYGVTVDPETREIGHGDAIYAIDASQHVILVYPPTEKAADLAHDAAALAGS